jgi:hypothetical protein
MDAAPVARGQYDRARAMKLREPMRVRYMTCANTPGPTVGFSYRNHYPDNTAPRLAAARRGGTAVQAATLRNYPAALPALPGRQLLPALPGSPNNASQNMQMELASLPAVEDEAAPPHRPPPGRGAGPSCSRCRATRAATTWHKSWAMELQAEPFLTCCRRHPSQGSSAGKASRCARSRWPSIYNAAGQHPLYIQYSWAGRL